MAETIDVREAISSPLTPDIAISPKSSVSHRTDDLSDQEDGEERSECNPVFYHHHNAHHLGREDQAVIENKEDKYFDASHQDPTLLSAAATPFVPGNASGGSSHARVAPPHNLQNRIVGGSHMINPTVAPTMAPAGNTFPFPIASIAVPSPQQLGHNMHQKMGVQPHTMVIPHPQVMILQGQDRTSNTIPFQFPVQFQPGGPIHISNGIQSPQMVAVPQPHASFPIVNPSILNSSQIPINLQQQILIQQQLALQKQYTMNQFNQNVFTASANSSSPRPVPAPSEAIRNQSMQQKQNTSTQGMNTNHASDSGTNLSLPVSTTNVPTQNSSKAETSTQNTSNHSGNTPTVILLLGVCGSGKTTLGRKLAVEHNYLFFSGGETLREHAYDSDMSKEWVRRRIATDALGQNLDALMHQSCKQKGIVIDRQGKSVEDMFYLNRILRSRKLQINAILVFETSDDEVLKLRIKERNLKESSRNEGTDEHVINERIRATRSVMERCVELFLQGQSNVLVARIDAGRDENIVMADMCASLASILSPAIQARAHNFSLPVLSENPNLVFVEDVVEYCNVIDRLMILLRQDHSTKFPGTSVSCYVNRHWLEAIGRHKHDAYKLTRKYHGPRFLYMRLKNEKCAYMIPRHMRCVFSIPEDIHESLSSGLILQSFADLDGDMILDGELLRVRRRADGNIIAHQENLMVSDVLVYNGKPVLRYSWDERQAILASLLHCESSLQSMQNRERLDDAVACPAPIKFFRKRFYDVCDIAEVIKVGDYPSDGIIFQHKREYKSGRDEKLLRWKPPSAITCDFRVANVERLSGSSVKRVYLEVLINDQRTRYVPLGNHLFVDLEPDSYRRTDVHFGVIIECSILDPVDPRNMKLRFVRVCTDKTVANYKQQIDELLSPAFHITAPKLIEYLTGVSETSQIPSRNFRARDESNKHHGWDQSQLANTDLFRAEWGSAHVPDNNEKESGFASNGHRMPKQTNSYSRGSGEHSSNDKEKWSSLRRGSNDVHGSLNQSASQREASSNRMRKPDKGFFNDGLTKSREDSGKRGDQTKRSSRDLRSAHQNSRCHGCHALTSKTVDDCNGHFYCYPCWSELGYGDCFSCGEFLKVQEYQCMFLCHACRPYYGCCAECHANGEEGERDKNDDRFYCYNCWDKYDDELKQLRGGNKNRRAKSRTATQSDTGRNPLKTSKRRAKNTDDNRAQQPKQGEVRQVNAEKKIVASESEMVKKDSNSSSENQRSDTQKCTSEQITTKIEQTSTEEVK